MWDFSVYVVLFAEDTVAAAAYSMSFDITPDAPFLMARLPGRDGLGLTINEPNGTNVALAECVVGFGGTPVLVDEYQFIALDSGCVIFRCNWPDATFTIGPNTSQDEAMPQYVTCTYVQKDCSAETGLVAVNQMVSAEPKSFSAIKSLYH